MQGDLNDSPRQSESRPARSEVAKITACIPFADHSPRGAHDEQKLTASLSTQANEKRSVSRVEFILGLDTQEWENGESIQHHMGQYLPAELEFQGQGTECISAKPSPFAGS
ncbi:hypothetical protein HO173_008025 [Letharia columbiana]|uniref:Uncharacterized protein n=1 Tax=Letharia columbiana TaxID=112416 RepID=A0A8H6L349_9LECA|nr:uncharacterized protein HO173_008025 [Letharia columbiana]KAF6233813.1 hypothetical protein HO173_008025 [Letharia columbiana]